jgi:hypothetical protein
MDDREEMVESPPVPAAPLLEEVRNERLVSRLRHSGKYPTIVAAG